MEYNDYPILTDEQYKLLNEQFLATPNTRKENVFKIFCAIAELINATPILQTKVNLNIFNSLAFAEKEMQKCLSNLKANFNLELNKKEVADINIFVFLKKLAKIMQNLILWQQTEQKEYYKQFALSLNCCLNNVNLNLISALASSNINLHKFM